MGEKIKVEIDKELDRIVRLKKNLATQGAGYTVMLVKKKNSSGKETHFIVIASTANKEDVIERELDPKIPPDLGS